jgi:cysteine desulfurase
VRAYFDHCRSTYVDKDVLDAMIPWWTEKYWAPASFTYTGTTAAEAIEKSQMAYAKLFGGKPGEVHFAQSHSLANNIAVQGAINGKSLETPHIITSAIEHGSTMDMVKQLEKSGKVKVTYIPVDKNGFVDLDVLRKSVTNDTVLVTMGAVNYMVGTIQPVEQISKIIKEANPDTLIHYDVTLGLGRLPNLSFAPLADLLTASIERIHGPKGITALWVKKGVPIKGPIYGSQAYSRIVPGTPDVPSIVGAAKALELMQDNLPSKIENMRRLRDRLIKTKR